MEPDEVVGQIVETIEDPTALVPVIETPLKVMDGRGALIFGKGHPKVGGRKKGALNKMLSARETATRMGFDPVAMCIKALLTGVMPGGKNGKDEHVPIKERVALLKDLLQYIQPKLSAVQVTGTGGGPIATVGLNLNDLLNKPEMAEMAQTLALAIAEKQTERLDNGYDDDANSDDD